MQRVAYLFLFLALCLSFNSCGNGLFIECFNDIDCPAGSICIEGFCQGGEECAFDNDCFDPAAVCVDGICVDAF